MSDQSPTPVAPTSNTTTAKTQTMKESATCKQTISEIHVDVIKYGAAIKEQKLPWMSIDALQSLIGQTEKKYDENGDAVYQYACGAGPAPIGRPTAQSDAIIKVIFSNTGKLEFIEGYECTTSSHCDFAYADPNIKF
jgi:hypothetical protein